MLLLNCVGKINTQHKITDQIQSFDTNEYFCDFNEP